LISTGEAGSDFVAKEHGAHSVERGVLVRMDTVAHAPVIKLRVELRQEMDLDVVEYFGGGVHHACVKESIDMGH
jgi:hypothetical protein